MSSGSKSVGRGERACHQIFENDRRPLRADFVAEVGGLDVLGRAGVRKLELAISRRLPGMGCGDA
jgi:hypothetical protein